MTFLIVVEIMAVGCGGSSTDVVPLTSAEKNLMHIAMAYMDAHSKLGRGPKDAEELKPFLQTFGEADALLKSPNDKEPFVIVWGADPTRGGPGEYQGLFPILAYEKKGTGGRRAVTDIRGRPLTVPEADLPKLNYVRGHKPAAN